MISEPIVIQPEISTLLEERARQSSKTVNELVNEALQYYFDAQQEEKLNQEIDAYESMHSELWRTMPYQWVAIHNRKLVDHDADDVALYRRVSAKYGRVSILIRRVRESPIEEIWIRTPTTGRVVS